FLKASPRTRKEKISNGDNKIAAWLGRETRVVIETYDDPNRAAKEAAEALVRHILNWGPEEKAPPKQGLKCTGITPLRGKGISEAGQFATRELVPERKAPPDDGAKDCHAWGYTRVTQSKPHLFVHALNDLCFRIVSGEFVL